MTNEAFRSPFLHFFRNGGLSKTDKLIARFLPGFVRKKNARTLTELFKSVTPDTASEKKEIRIEKYSGQNPVALKIARRLENESSSLAGAYVHGSIGTGEEIPYSDFDGLVIVKNTALENANDLIKLAVILKDTEKTMYEMDPLQHHGWFVMSEADLQDYPQSYFPQELFSHAKCLCGAAAFSIGVRENEFIHEYRRSFEKLTQSILKKLNSRSFLQNYYVLKNLLSEFMLLPAIYFQAKTGKGIFKKQSFELLEKEMGGAYEVMHAISAMRKNWNYKPPAEYAARLKTISQPNTAGGLSGRPDASLVHRFETELIPEMRTFVMDLRNRVAI